MASIKEEVEYLRNVEDGVFDYCFADIWIGIEDITPYFAVKEIGRKLRKKIDYWIEEETSACAGYNNDKMKMS